MTGVAYLVKLSSAAKEIPLSVSVLDDRVCLPGDAVHVPHTKSFPFLPQSLTTGVMLSGHYQTDSLSAPVLDDKFCLPGDHFWVLLNRFLFSISL